MPASNLILIYIGNFYFTLGNMHPKYRSRLSAIQLLCIVKTNIIKMYGMDAILKPFIEDVKELVCIYTVYS